MSDLATAVLDDVDLSLVLDSDPADGCECPWDEEPCPRVATHVLLAPCHDTLLCLVHAERVARDISAAAQAGEVWHCSAHGIDFPATALRVVPKGDA